MNIAIVLAGGTGSRMNSKIPKQFIKINDNPIISYTLTAFETSNLIDKIIIVSLKEYKEEIEKISSLYKISKLCLIVENGTTRQKSVFNALSEINKFANKDDIIVIHDGVRAMITSELIDKCIIDTKKYGATTLAEKSKNTMVLAKNKIIENFINRDYVYNIQTPQSFKFELIFNAHINATESGYDDITDDTQLILLDKKSVNIIENNELNIKLTTKEDIILFEYFLQKKSEF